MIRTELYIDKSQAEGIAEQGLDFLRPQLVEFATQAAENLKQRIVSRISRQGISAPGGEPGSRSGDYARSFESDVRSLKRSIQGRVGSVGLLAGVKGRAGVPMRFLASWLEMGTRKMRPRPHIGPAFEAWRQSLNRELNG